MSVRALLGAVALFSLVGCSQSTSGLSTVSKKLGVARRDSPIVRVVCLWEPAEGTGIDGAPARGFAGQILFFNAVDATPVRVDGKVEVYQFDDMGTVEEQSKPIHKFAFDSGAWNLHLVTNGLGPSYNVFLPYVKKHSFQTTCALRLRFTPEVGSPVYSEMHSVTLRGKENPEALHATKTTRSGSMQELLHERLRDLGLDSAGRSGTESDSSSASERVLGNTRIVETPKTDDRLRTLSIRQTR